MMGDWYHNTSTEIMDALDTPQGYQGVCRLASIKLMELTLALTVPSCPAPHLCHVQWVWNLELYEVRNPRNVL